MVEIFCDGPRVIACPTYTYTTEGEDEDDFNDNTITLYTHFEVEHSRTWVVDKKTTKNKYKRRLFTIDHDLILISHYGLFTCFSPCSQTYLDIANISKIEPSNNASFEFDIYYNYSFYDQDYEEEEGGQCREIDEVD